ncbi:2-isopropylmalate synthase [Chengkuizengella axinellae]
MKNIRIFDTTLRDGEQAPGGSLSIEEKVRIAKQLANLGVDVIEPGFPISSQGEFTAVQQISRDLLHVEICGFARAVTEDINRAIEATQDATKRSLHLFISSSDIHLDFQLKKSRDQVIQIAREKVAYAKQFVDRIEFSPMDASRTGNEFLLEMVEAVVAEGATLINIPDTVGFALPNEYGQIFKMLKNNVRGGKHVEYSAHCHNDLGMAVANSLAAIEAGATQIEVTVNGIGERAGNCSLEELVMAIETRKEALGVQTNINTEEIFETSRLVSRIMNFPIAFNKPIVGRNAFQHEAGIHQDGLLKNRNTYEIMNPEKLGVPREMIILGKHSGRHAIKHRVSEMGVPLNPTQLEDLYTRFKAFADQHKSVTDEQLAQLVGKATNTVMENYMITDIKVFTQHHKKAATATVINQITHEENTFLGKGKGPVEAIISSIKQAIPLDVKFIDLELYSLSSGENANGEAIVTIEIEGRKFKGTCIDEDIMFSIAKGFISAINQCIRENNIQESSKIMNQ